MRKYVLFFITVLMIFMGANFAFGETVEKADENVSYMEVRISKGDTLWSISEKYKSEDESIMEYVEKLMEFNNMKNDRINAGQNIIVMVNY